MYFDGNIDNNYSFFCVSFERKNPIKKYVVIEADGVTYGFYISPEGDYFFLNTDTSCKLAIKILKGSYKPHIIRGNIGKDLVRKVVSLFPKNGDFQSVTPEFNFGMTNLVDFIYDQPSDVS